MATYLIRRLLLLPLTLFAIILVNFVIINLAPGDPTSVTEISAEGGASRREGANMAFGSDMRYLQFREHYGLTLPILFNTWPWLSYDDVYDTLNTLLTKKEEMSLKDYDALRIKMGDQARFVMPHLLKIMQNGTLPIALRELANRFFIRGGTRQAVLGLNISVEDKAYNKKIAQDNFFLLQHAFTSQENADVIQKKITEIAEWYQVNKEYYEFEPTGKEKIALFFFDTRFFRYMSRVVTFDFGTLRNDPNKPVMTEVIKRFKYSLTLSIIPMIVTVVLCQIFGFWMAYRHNRFSDRGLNLIFLVLYAIPVFVVVPFLIEKIALYHNFPWSHTPIPISGFTSSESVYSNLTSLQRLQNVLQHLMLPWIAVMYGSLAAQTRLSRTAVLEVMRQDYVRTAKAKGLNDFDIMTKHVGRNASITIVTSVAASLGVVLGGSLIVETLFDINGFGKFFYDAVINRDYNVIMFSAIAGSFLALVGYLIADILYMLLDPRISLESS